MTVSPERNTAEDRFQMGRLLQRHTWMVDERDR